MSIDENPDFNDWLAATVERVTAAHGKHFLDLGAFIRDLASDDTAQPALDKGESRAYLRQVIKEGDLFLEPGASATVLRARHGGATSKADDPLVPCIFVAAYSSAADVADGSHGQPVIGLVVSPQIAADYLSGQGVPVLAAGI